MAKSTSRVQKPWESPPEEWIPLAVLILNSKRGETLKRTREVVDPRALLVMVKRLQRLELLTSKRRQPGGANEREVLRVSSAINRFLSRYNAKPLLQHMERGLLQDWPLHWLQIGKKNRQFLELRMVLAVMEIAQTGRISALKQCSDCRKWLFARFSHQRFCSDQCKEHFHHFNEADKKRRRDWARTNYQTRKILEAGSIKAANQRKLRNAGRKSK